MHTLGSATAVALEGAVLHPGLFSVLGSGVESGLEEVLVLNSSVLQVPLRELPLHGGVRVVLVLRDGSQLLSAPWVARFLHKNLDATGSVAVNASVAGDAVPTVNLNKSTQLSLSESLPAP